MSAPRPSAEPGAGTSGLPERLRERRRAAGLSQAELAEGIVDPSYISLLEAGRRTPTPDVVAALAARLGVSTSQLVGDELEGLDEAATLAAAALGLGRHEEALALVAPWQEHLGPEAAATDPRLLRLAEVQAAALERSGRLREASAAYEQLRTAAERSPGTVPWLAPAIALVRCYRDAGDLSRAIDVGEQAVATLTAGLRADDGLHATLVSTLAGAYSERGDHARARLLLDDLITRTAAGGSTDDLARAAWNAAITATESGDPAEGWRLVHQADALLRLGDDLHGQARIQVTVAWVMLAAPDPDAEGARAVLRAALPGLRQHAESVMHASAETELGRCELLLGRPEVAVRHARASLSRLGADQPLEAARARAVLGAALVALGEDAEGVVELELAAELLAVVGAPRQAAVVWRSLADVYRGLGDASRALDAADRALSAAGLPTDRVSAPATGARARSLRNRVTAES